SKEAWKTKNTCKHIAEVHWLDAQNSCQPHGQTTRSKETWGAKTHAALCQNILVGCTKWLPATWSNNNKEQGGMANKEQIQAYGKGTLSGCTKWPP
ncbi:hypothetical protein NDU88_002591, partial [Pleurodeles waltl]